MPPAPQSYPQGERRVGHDEPSPEDGAGPELHNAKAGPTAMAGPELPTIVASSLQSRPHSGHAAEAVLDKLNRGVVIFDDSGRVHYANNAALQAAQGSGAIAIVDGRLGFGEPAAQERFEAFLQQGRERADGGTGQSSVVMRIGTRAGRPPFRVLLSPLNTVGDTAAGGRPAGHVLMIYEPHADRHVPKRILRELYSLSDAEADLTVLLFEGESLDAASQRLHISVNTAKTHLHHVFVKCDVHSQGELLQLLSLGPRTL
jgi:DNA-binding CsgD family transcriptional regulator